LESKRALIEPVFRGARQRGGELDRARQRQLGKQQRQRCVVLAFVFATLRRRPDNEHEFAALPVGILSDPRRGFSQRTSMNALEALGELARDDDLALRT